MFREKKEMLLQHKGERQKIHITRQEWVDIFISRAEVGDGERLNLRKEAAL